MKNIFVPIVAVTLLFTSASKAQNQTHQSERFGYQLAIPLGWKVSQTGFDVMFYSYRTNEALPHGMLPPRGAEIWVTPFNAIKERAPAMRWKGANSVQQWIQHELTPDHTNVSVTRVQDVDDRDAPKEVFRVEADYRRDPADDELQHEISYFFTLEGRMYRLALLYWRDNDSGQRLKRVLEAVLQSARAFPQRSDN